MDCWNRVSVNTGRDARHEYNACVLACPAHTGCDAWIEEDLAPKVSRTLDDRTQRLASRKGDNVDIAGDRIEFS